MFLTSQSFLTLLTALTCVTKAVLGGGGKLERNCVCLVPPLLPLPTTRARA